MSVEELPLEVIRRDGGTQSRAFINGTVAENYAEAMQEGESFPPAIVFYDGADYWLADGYHRAAAAERCGFKTYAFEVRQGTQRQAILHSLGANAKHGLDRTEQDKRRAIQVLLDDSEWKQWSDSEIARQCGFTSGKDRKLVSDMRPSCPRGQDKPAARTVTRKGKTYSQNTTNIGKTKKEPNPPPDPEPPDPQPFTDPDPPPPPAAATPDMDALNDDVIADVLHYLRNLMDPQANELADRLEKYSR